MYIDIIFMNRDNVLQCMQENYYLNICICKSNDSILSLGIEFN